MSKNHQKPAKYVEKPSKMSKNNQEKNHKSQKTVHNVKKPSKMLKNRHKTTKYAKKTSKKQ